MPKAWHYAVVAGIDEYPRFENGTKNLRFPLADANDMAKWLCKSTGGDLPARQVKVITRHKPKKRKPPVPLDQEIYDAIWESVQDFRARLDTEPNAVSRKAAWEESRFYLYMSGHGLDAEGDDAVLLAANTEKNVLGYHVSARRVLNALKTNKVFAEIAVFVDSCRDWTGRSVKDPPWDMTYPGPAISSLDSRCFFASASRTRKQAFEPKKDSGLKNGLFTHALLAALDNGVGDVGVDSDTLRSYLFEAVPELARIHVQWPDAAAMENQERPVQKPEVIDCDPGIVFLSKTTAQRSLVRVRLRPDSPFAAPFAGGFDAVVYSDGIVSARFPFSAQADGSFEARLGFGGYLLVPSGAPIKASTPNYSLVLMDELKEEVVL